MDLRLSQRLKIQATSQGVVKTTLNARNGPINASFPPKHARPV